MNGGSTGKELQYNTVGARGTDRVLGGQRERAPHCLKEGCLRDMLEKTLQGGENFVRSTSGARCMKEQNAFDR